MDSSGSSSGGSTGGKGLYDCGLTARPPDAGDCASGSLSGVVLDLLSCDRLANVTVQALDARAVPVSGSVVTGDGGTFVLCGPDGGAFTPYLKAPGYETTYLEELQGSAPSVYGEIGLFSTMFLTDFATIVPGNLDLSLGTIVAFIGTSGACPDSSGWAVSLTDPDGGAIPDGGFELVYFAASDLPKAGLTATTSQGAAIFYNIDLSTTNYFAVGLSKPDAGNCTPRGTTAFPTGRIYATQEAISLYILQVP